MLEKGTQSSRVWKSAKSNNVANDPKGQKGSEKVIDMKGSTVGYCRLV